MHNVDFSVQMIRVIKIAIVRSRQNTHYCHQRHLHSPIASKIPYLNNLSHGIIQGDSVDN